MRAPFFLIFLQIIVFSKNVCEAYNILGIVGWPSFSHQRAFTDLWRQLSLKGHDVTVITTNPLREKDLTNLTEIDISEGYTFLEEKYDWSRYVVKTGNPIIFSQNMIKMRNILAEFYIQLPQIQDLINNKSQKFDVVLNEALFTQLLIFGEVFNAPTISISSFDPTATIHSVVGNPWSPIVYPSVMFPFAKPYNFLQRVVTTVMTNFLKYRIAEADTTSNTQMLARNFPNITETMENMMNKISFHFTAVNPLLLTPRPHAARYIVIGGNARMEETQSLSKDVQKFLDSASEGFIYFSLGSNVKAEFLGQDFVESIAAVLKQIPYKILWKTTDTNVNVSSNIKLVKWIPQRYVLKHRNIKVFVTQGGIQSIEEAILSETPMVGLPIFGDQEHNVYELIRHGIINRVSRKDTNFRIKLRTAILEVFNNKEYQHNIARFSKLSQDQLISGTKKAIWYIEYAIRWKGDVSHLENRYAKTIPWYQYFLIDVLAFLLVLVSTLVFGVYIILRLLRKLVLWLIYGRASHDKSE